MATIADDTTRDLLSWPDVTAAPRR